MSKKRESCKERDIFFDWNHEIDQDKHFFKIMVVFFDCTGVFIICSESGNLA